MLVSASADAIARVVELTTAYPGLSRAAAAARLGGRRTTALQLLDAALDAGQVHYADSQVPARGGTPRSVRGLLPGPSGEVVPEAAPTSELLRALREQAGVSLGSLAEHLGVTRALVQHWESGRQASPTWLGARLAGALEAAQTTNRPRRRRDARRQRGLLEQVRRQPGLSRWALVGKSVPGRAMLEHALAAGQLHEGPAWAGHQPTIGIFPGRRSRQEPTHVHVAELRTARLEAGWSHAALGLHIGAAGTTIARWERELDVVPAWASDAAAAALLTARAARRDDRSVVLAAITAEPGLSRKSLLVHLGYTAHANRIHGNLDALIAEGQAHERHAGEHGQQRGVYPGPLPATVLSPEELRGLRSRAGLEQRDLAEQLGTHVQAIRDWEGSRRPMSLEWQQRLRQHLEAQPERAVDAHEQLLEDLEAAVVTQPRPLRQLHLLDLASIRRTDAALAELVAAGRVHQGRLPAPASIDKRGRAARGRLGYLPGAST